MKLTILAQSVLCCSLIASIAQAAPPRSVDARTLDVAGVTTGMDYDQVVAALAGHFQVPPSEIKADPFPSENVVTHTKLPSTVSFSKDGTQVTVHFEGRVPVDPVRPLVAWLIRYEVPWTPENAKQMAQAATGKYGIQSNAPNTLPMQWCSHPSTNTGIGCTAGEARLELSQVALSLTDPAWQAARIRLVQERQAVRPKL